MRLLHANYLGQRRYARHQNIRRQTGHNRRVQATRRFRHAALPRLRGGRSGRPGQPRQPDQAALIFAAEHYPDWEEKLRLKLSPGAFSENLTVEGATESALCVGDIFRVGGRAGPGDAAPPAFGKLAHKLGESRLVDWVIDAHQGGSYVRVLEEGWVVHDATFKQSPNTLIASASPRSTTSSTIACAIVP